ncbi:MAG: homocysteine S-methyltransferase family protein [Bacteroidetes bacterium]|nr:homocysteine S-methyltransferase family protein [Bacteroidota bacterium]
MRTTGIQELLKSRSLLFCDGAWGTIFQFAGLKPGESCELWNRDQRKKVLEVAQSYVDLGVDMIETNSFRGNGITLAGIGLENDAVELNRLAAEISREAAGDKCLVLGSVGPTGKILMMGDVSENEMYDTFAEQVHALEQGGADAICIETMSALDEAELAVKAAVENTDLEVVCTFTFVKTMSGDYKTVMGITPAQMAEKLLSAGASIIGTNCGYGMEAMIPIVKAFRDFDSNIPLLVQANAGIPKIEDGKTVFPETPDEMAGHVPDLIDAGVSIIGGCCGTTPDHITAIMNKAKVYHTANS